MRGSLVFRLLCYLLVFNLVLFDRWVLLSHY